jgi:adenosylmethionine-8-amino-7-oxononanoate aminotransferase
MRSIDLARRVAAVERRITAALGELGTVGIALRGRGALWIVEPPPGVDLEAAARRIYALGAVVGYAGRFLLILPPATITPRHLETACGIVREELLAAVRRTPARA